MLDKIDFDSPIVIKNFYGFMDGGSILLECLDAKNQEFEIWFNQKMTFEVYDRLPGRIQINKDIVPVRSVIEEKILKSIKPKLKPFGKLERMERKMLKEYISYVESEQYIMDYEKMKKITEANKD